MNLVLVLIADCSRPQNQIKGSNWAKTINAKIYMAKICYWGIRKIHILIWHSPSNTKIVNTIHVVVSIQKYSVQSFVVLKLEFFYITMARIKTNFELF